MGTGQNVTL